MATARLPLPGYRARLHALPRPRDAGRRRLRARFFDALEDGQAAADLCRRRHRRRRGGARRCAPSSTPSACPSTTTLMGLGAHRHHRPAGAAHAGHARHRLRQLRGRGLRLPAGRWARASTTASPACRDDFAPRAKFLAQVDIDPAEIDKVKARRLAPRRRPGAGAGTPDRLRPRARRAATDLGDWHAHVAALKRDHAMNYDRDTR